MGYGVWLCANRSSVFLRGSAAQQRHLWVTRSASRVGSSQQLRLGVRLKISSRWIIRSFVSWIAFESAASGHSASVCRVSTMAVRGFGDASRGFGDVGFDENLPGEEVLLMLFRSWSLGDR